MPTSRQSKREREADDAAGTLRALPEPHETSSGAFPAAFCPRCGAAMGDPVSFVQEYWTGIESRFHCWCRMCGFTFEVVPVERVVGHEAEE